MPPIQQRKNSLRLSNYDYSLPGAYFITICTQNRLHLFGHISNGEMVLNDYGKVVKDVWKNLPNHYQNMECGQFVVMPNHIHGVMFLKPIDHTKGGFENPENAKEGRFQNPKNAKEGCFHTHPNEDENCGNAKGRFQTCPNESRQNKTSGMTKGGFETHPNQKQTRPNKIHGIPEIVRALKTFSARKINEIRNSPGEKVWQRNYWDRVVRNERALQAINRYIQNNPLKWHLDHLWTQI